jgi:hypothetical protein
MLVDCKDSRRKTYLIDPEDIAIPMRMLHLPVVGF